MANNKKINLNKSKKSDSNNDLDKLLSDIKVNSDNIVKNDRKPISKHKGTTNSVIKVKSNDSKVEKTIKDNKLSDSYTEYLPDNKNTQSNIDKDLNSAENAFNSLIDKTKKANTKSVPFSNKFLPKIITDRIKKFNVKSNTTPNINSNDNLNESQITDTLQTIFGAQRLDNISRDNVNEYYRKLDRKTQKQQFAYTAKVQSDISSGIARLVGYQDTVMDQYYRKSLELQHRHYFATRDNLELNKLTYISILEQLASITKNTSLPNENKVNLSESFSSANKKALIGQAQRILKSNLGTMYDRGKSNLGSFKEDFMESFTNQSNSYNSNTSYKSATSGMLGPSDNVRSGQMAGKRLATMLSGGIKTLRTNEKVDKLIRYSENIPGRFNRKMKESNGKGFYGLLDNVIGNAAGPTERVNHNLYKDSTLAVPWDMMSRRTLIEIIPGFMARTLEKVSDIYSFMSGSKVKDERQHFSVLREKFVGKSQALKDIRTMSRNVISPDIKHHANEIIDYVDPKGTLTTSERIDLTIQLAKDSAQHIDFDPLRYATNNVSLPNGSGKKIAKLFKLAFEIDNNYSGIGKSTRIKDVHARLSGSFSKIKYGLGDYNQILSKLNEHGTKELGRDIGLIDSNTGKVNQNYKFDVLRDMLTHGSSTPSTLGKFNNNPYTGGSSGGNYNPNNPPIVPGSPAHTFVNNSTEQKESAINSEMLLTRISTGIQDLTAITAQTITNPEERTSIFKKLYLRNKNDIKNNNSFVKKAKSDVKGIIKSNLLPIFKLNSKGIVGVKPVNTETESSEDKEANRSGGVNDILKNRKNKEDKNKPNKERSNLDKVKTAGKNLSRLGSGIKDIASKAVGVIGELAPAAAIGAGLVASYTMGKTISNSRKDLVDIINTRLDSKLNGKMEQYRFLLYGTNINSKGEVAAIKYLERSMKRHLTVSNTGKINFDLKPNEVWEQYGKVFGNKLEIDTSDSKSYATNMLNENYKRRGNEFLSWFYKRFLNIFIKHTLICKTVIKGNLEDLDKTSPVKMKLFIDNSQFTEKDLKNGINPMAVKFSPWENIPLTDNAKLISNLVDGISSAARATDKINKINGEGSKIKSDRKIDQKKQEDKVREKNKATASEATLLSKLFLDGKIKKPEEKSFVSKALDWAKTNIWNKGRDILNSVGEGAKVTWGQAKELGGKFKAGAIAVGSWVNKNVVTPVKDSLAALIQGAESGKAGYNAYNRGTVGNKILGPLGPRDLTKMTISEILADMQRPHSDEKRLFAVGKYQCIPSTLQDAVLKLGIPPDTLFDANCQERIFSEYLLDKKHNKISAYIKGTSDDINGAMSSAASEWASIADPSTGNSKYGHGNMASVTPQAMAGMLTKSRSLYKQYIASGMKPDEAYQKAVSSNGNDLKTSDNNDTKTTNSATSNVSTLIPTPISPTSNPKTIDSSNPNSTSDVINKFNNKPFNITDDILNNPIGVPSDNSANNVPDLTHISKATLQVGDKAGKQRDALLDIQKKQLDATMDNNKLLSMLLDKFSTNATSNLDGSTTNTAKNIPNNSPIRPVLDLTRNF